MKTIRRSHERGHANHGWLDTHHSFSFGSYYDPKHMNWRYLRVLNDDHIAAGAGFPTHPHDNMEIFSYVTEGILEHKDSLGSTAQVKPGRAQLMSAGSGITHSEYNPSKENPTHLYQVWIMPAKRNQNPRYQELDFPLDSLKEGPKLLASPDGEGGSMEIAQNVRIYAAKISKGQSIDFTSGDYGWLQVLSGEVIADGETLGAGDALGTEGEKRLQVEGQEEAELLWFSMDES